MGWPQKLESLTAKMGVRFLDYDLATGTWSFRVQQFSKYGLADSDDEMDENETVGQAGKSRSNHLEHRHYQNTMTK